MVYRKEIETLIKNMSREQGYGITEYTKLFVEARKMLQAILNEGIQETLVK